jgi:hypothetical protein
MPEKTTLSGGYFLETSLSRIMDDSIEIMVKYAK